MHHGNENQGGNQDRDSYTLKLINHNPNQIGSIGLGIQQHDDSMAFGGDEEQSTEKWNPLTFAVYAGNLPLIKYIIKNSLGNL